MKSSCRHHYLPSMFQVCCFLLLVGGPSAIEVRAAVPRAIASIAVTRPPVAPLPLRADEGKANDDAATPLRGSFFLGSVCASLAGKIEAGGGVTKRRSDTYTAS